MIDANVSSPKGRHAQMRKERWNAAAGWDLIRRCCCCCDTLGGRNTTAADNGREKIYRQVRGVMEGGWRGAASVYAALNGCGGKVRTG